MENRFWRVIVRLANILAIIVEGLVEVFSDATH